MNTTTNNITVNAFGTILIIPKKDFDNYIYKDQLIIVEEKKI